MYCIYKTHGDSIYAKDERGRTIVTSVQDGYGQTYSIQKINENPYE